MADCDATYNNNTPMQGQKQQNDALPSRVGAEIAMHTHFPGIRSRIEPFRAWQNEHQHVPLRVFRSPMAAALHAVVHKGSTTA